MDKKTKIIKEWLDKAEQDLGMAQLALEHRPTYRTPICFHCQQAAEKYLKAYLVSRDIIFKKTHSLVYLLDLIAEKENVPEKLYSHAETLEAFGVAVRYPGYHEPTAKDVQTAYQAAIYIKKTVLRKI